MDLVVRTVRPRNRTRIGVHESIPHWGLAARAALGMLALVALASPFVILFANVFTAPQNPGLSTGIAFAMIVSDTLLVFFFGSFVMQNPRIYGFRTAWLVALLLAAPIALPLYWAVHIWNAPFVGDYEQDDPLPSGLSSRRHY